MSFYKELFTLSTAFSTAFFRWFYYLINSFFYFSFISLQMYHLLPAHFESYITFFGVLRFPAFCSDRFHKPKLCRMIEFAFKKESCSPWQSRLLENFWFWYLQSKVRCAILFRLKSTTGCGAVGSALDWGSRGREFKSRHSDQLLEVEVERFRPLIVFTATFQQGFKAFVPACF